MKNCPLQHQGQRTPRKFSPQHRERLDLDQRFVFAIFRMKMSGVVIVEVHSDHNPKESADLRHLRSYFGTAPSTNRSRSLWYFAAAVWSMYTMWPDSKY